MSILVTEEEIRKAISDALKKESLFKQSRGSGSNTGSGRRARVSKSEKYSIDQLIFEQIDLSKAAETAAYLHSQIGRAGVKESEGSGGKTIVRLVHEPLYDKIKGAGAMKRDKSGKLSLFDYYSKNLKTNHWSSWFLNRCYMDTPAWPYIESIAKGFKHSGCCYPYAKIAASNRPAVFNKPENMKGKTMLMIFSKEEIEASPDLALTPGVASIVGQGGGQPSWDNIRRTTKLKSGDKHMNVMVSKGNWIGGNLSNSTGSRNDGNKNGFMLLVKFVGIRESRSMV